MPHSENHYAFFSSCYRPISHSPDERQCALVSQVRTVQLVAIAGLSLGRAYSFSFDDRYSIRSIGHRVQRGGSGELAPFFEFTRSRSALDGAQQPRERASRVATLGTGRKFREGQRTVKSGSAAPRLATAGADRRDRRQPLTHCVARLSCGALLRILESPYQTSRARCRLAIRNSRRPPRPVDAPACSRPHLRRWFSRARLYIHGPHIDEPS